MAAAQTDMTGKRVMITGFTSGIGRAAAHALGGMGAELVLVCRNADKGQNVLNELRARIPNVQADMLVGDLGVLADIRRVGEEFLSIGRALDILFNNAGVVMQRRTTTPDGFETTFAINHLGYFLLTALLREPLRASGGGRVVSTASDAHKFGGGAMRFDDLQAERKYSTFGVYGQSKLANILFTRELARREQAYGVTANSFHPGFVGSGFSKNNGTFARVLMTAISPFSRSPEKGAETGVHLCSSPDVANETGTYFFDCKERKLASYARSDEDARRLWEVSEQLTGLEAT
jgi:NAD(P)-dependent dehydrogenase (short-subunit alcohol dehydrogenase family)